MFQTSSKSAQHRRSGAGSATAVVLLGAGLACTGQARADEGTGLEALDTLAATARAGFAAPPAVQAETNNPYLAAASSSMAGWTPASQDQASARQADPGVAVDVAALGTPDASGLATPPTAQAPSDMPALAAAEQALQDELRGRSDVAARAAPETAGAADVTSLPAAQVATVARKPRLLAAHGDANAAGWKKPAAQERLEDLRGGFAAAGRPTPDTFDAAGNAGPSAAQEPRVPEARSTMASWKPVAQERLDELRGGFDVGAGLQVSFGIERAVFINGALVVSTSLNIPDVSRITADQASRLAAALGVAVGAGATATTAVNNALAANPVTAGMGSSSTGSSGSSSGSSGSSSAGASAGATGSPGASVTSLPAMAISAGSAVVTTNGLLNLIQNGPGNSAAAGALAGSPATVIQNTLNNQSIQSLVTINAGVNTLQAFRDQVSGLALTNALLNSASRR
ncbi:hypothetical protein RA280_05845 [Cupriavidus sp. CV2]|uniref:hypothetical protein n=1 Tax=Cupriavidus ulmosensis TaxID=3065913 RepID=UPI00296B0177|nr:hypothetical protein [Cupriavidus sp. CV2]MDW3681271.1 hypothetical protein [Cupriavidus sp. CV2]